MPTPYIQKVSEADHLNQIVYITVAPEAPNQGSGPTALGTVHTQKTGLAPERLQCEYVFTEDLTQLTGTQAKHQD